ncbi:hypothetical protein WJX84_000806 [Apatococcus fuscideae]|uniref:peptidylprolyl isomerase n=1 Tax=Apatococcus fuscideae TaxID=2026836 RepID=A0AAW1T263_9CHLO
MGFASISQLHVNSGRAALLQRRSHQQRVISCCAGGQPASIPARNRERRQALLGLVGVSVGLAQLAQPATAFPGFKKELNRNRRSIPESEYKSGPEGLRYYDLVEGSGDTAKPGQRVAVHFEAKWKGITFITSRQGMGVTGGTPLGFDIGADSRGGQTLKGLDLGVRGMKVNGQRKLLVPPELAYGERGFGGEIPPNATLEFDVQLLSIKKDARGYQAKLVEG